LLTVFPVCSADWLYYAVIYYLSSKKNVRVYKYGRMVLYNPTQYDGRYINNTFINFFDSLFTFLGVIKTSFQLSNIWTKLCCCRQIWLDFIHLQSIFCCWGKMVKIRKKLKMDFSPSHFWSFKSFLLLQFLNPKKWKYVLQ